MRLEEARSRDDPRLALPANLPREFQQYDTPVTILGAGNPGKLGLLELEFAVHDGISRMVRRYHRPPLQIFRPLHYDPNRPDMAFVMIVQHGGGMLQGDRYRIDVTCREGTALHLTTQSASKLYKCEENFITQEITIATAANSIVEYLPDLTIPYRHSRFFQRTLLQIDPSATVIVGEILTPGRTAFGEHHDYDIFYSQMEARDPSGRLLVADTIKLEPARHAPNGPALLGPYDVLGVLYVFAQRLPAAELTTHLRRALATDEKTRSATTSGVSELPNGCGVAVRILGKTGAAVEQARTVVWNAARMALLGVPAPDLRKA
jgi:urease accessory protein